MKVEKQKITRKQHKAIAALIQTPTIKEAAAIAGIGESTLFRWLRNEAFQDCYRQARHEAVRSAMARLSQASGEAVRVLEKIMNDSEAPASFHQAPRVTSPP